MVTAYQYELGAAAQHPCLKKIPLAIEMRMEEVSEEQDLLGAEVLDDFVEELEVSINGFIGYSGPVFAEMRYLTQVYITDQQSTTGLPEECTAGVAPEFFSLNGNGFLHRAKVAQECSENKTNRSTC